MKELPNHQITTYRPGAPIGASAPGAPPAEAYDAELSVRDVFEILLRGKWYILASFVVVFLGTAVYTFRQEPVYESSSVLFVNNQQELSPIGEVLGVSTVNRNISNEVEIIRSVSSARRVAEALLSMQRVTANLNALPVFQTESGKLPGAAQLAGRIRGRVTVVPVGSQVDLIKITVSSTAPEEAQLLANLYAQTYRDFNRKASRSRATASREFLDEITGQFSVRLRQAENQLTSFLNQERIVQPDEEARQLIEQVTKLQSLQYQTQLELGVAHAEISSLEAEIADLTPGLTSQASSSEHLIVDQLKRQMAALQVEQQQIYARNPDSRNTAPRGRLLEIEEEVAQLRSQLEDRARNLVDQALTTGIIDAGGADGSGTASMFTGIQALQSQITAKHTLVDGLEARLNIANRQLEGYKARLAQIPTNALILQRLQRSQQAQEQLYLTLLEKMQEARIAEQSELGYIEIIDEAQPSGSPVSPRIPQSLAFGGIFGLLLGMGLAFVRNAFDNTLRKPEDVQKQGYNTLGIIPDLHLVIRKQFGSRKWVNVRGKTYATSLVPLFNPQSPASEEYRRLRTNIHFSHPNPDIRTILITSASPGEGKTVTSVNLAVAIAQSGRRTLYLEADLRLPTGHLYFGLKRTPGLTDLVHGHTSFNAPDFSTPVENLYLISAGSPAVSPNDILGCSRMHEMMAVFRDHFDVIVIDTPPVLAVADALLLAPMADVSLLVCSAARTNRQALNRATEALQNVGAHLGGIVLNRFDPQKSYGWYGYGYPYGFGQYPGHSVLEVHPNAQEKPHIQHARQESNPGN